MKTNLFCDHLRGGGSGFPAVTGTARRRLIRLCPGLLLLFNLACAAPLVHSREELSRNIGKRVSVEGTYGVDETGEHVRSGGGELDVMLDVSPEVLGLGRGSPPPGARVRASGRVERGAMAMGVFIDEPTLSLRRGSADHPLLPGFVLRDAKVERVESSASPQAAPGPK